MLRRLVVLLTALLLAPGVAALDYGGHSPSAVEQAQLPLYCYAQFVDKKYAADPRYSIRNCGGSMNHFCPGLLLLIRAQKVSDPPKTRKSNASRAEKDIMYTLNGMSPECPLRGDAEAALAKARAIQKYVK